MNQHKANKANNISTKFLASSLCILTALSGISMPVDARYLPISRAKSQVKWTGKKVLGQHEGKVAIKDAKVDINKQGQITKAEIEIDMDNISVTDLSGALASKLLEHLKSQDFFNVAKFGTAKFESSSVKKLADNKYQFDGNLVIKEISQPLSFVGTYSKQAKLHKLKGNFEFDRTAYKIQYGSGQFFTNLGDKMILDEVVVAFDLVTE